MAKKVKIVKPKTKPKVKKEKVRKAKVKASEETKQNVNVKVLIDQSKKGRISRGGGGAIPRPATIINFPSNNPVSEIRYSPEIRYLPSPTQEPASMPMPPPPPAPSPSAPLGMTDTVNLAENVLARPQIPSRSEIYRSPYRDETMLSTGISFLNDSFPDASEPSVLGAVSSTGSILLSEAYPEYSDVFQLASKFSQSNIAKKGANRISKLAGDAWENLSMFTQKTIPKTVVSSNLPASIASTEYSSNIYDYLNYDSAMDNSTIPTQNDIFSVPTRSTLPTPMPNAFTEQTLTSQIESPRQPAQVSDEELPFVAGAVAGRVMAIENKIRRPKEQSEYDRWRSENKGKYTRAEQGDAWAEEKKRRDQKKDF